MDHHGFWTTEVRFTMLWTTVMYGNVWKRKVMVIVCTVCTNICMEVHTVPTHAHHRAALLLRCDSVRNPAWLRSEQARSRRSLQQEHTGKRIKGVGNNSGGF